MKNLYSILGIEPNASAEEIKRAYRVRSKETHPDKNKHPEAAEMFKEVQTAFDILSDPERREAYDRSGDAESASVGLDRIELMLKGSIAAIIRRAEPGVDILAALKGQIIGCTEQKRAELDEAQRELERLNTFKGKTARTTEGPNVFEIAVADLISQKEMEIIAHKGDLEDAQAMFKHLTEYRSAVRFLPRHFVSRFNDGGGVAWEHPLIE